MTDDALRIAIAKARGWEPDETKRGMWWTPLHNTLVPGPPELDRWAVDSLAQLNMKGLLLERDPKYGAYRFVDMDRKPVDDGLTDDPTRCVLFKWLELHKELPTLAEPKELPPVDTRQDLTLIQWLETALDYAKNGCKTGVLLCLSGALEKAASFQPNATPCRVADDYPENTEFTDESKKEQK